MHHINQLNQIAFTYFRRASLINIRRLSRASTEKFPNILLQKSELNNAISEAEKVVGYPTSFLNLRWILTDEIANIALQFRKLIGLNHPLIQTARKTFFSNNNAPAWGLIVLLISKVAGLNSHFQENEKDVTAGILHNQRMLAEITEMIRTSTLLHKSLLILNKDEQKELKELLFGNKIALLGGDYLLSCSFSEMALIRNQNLQELMSSALRDVMEAEFIGPRDNQHVPLPNRPINLDNNLIVPDHFDTEPYEAMPFLGNPRAEWTIRNVLGGATLLGKSCNGALKLAKHPEETQKLGYLFGKYVALACQVQIESETFKADNLEPINLTSAPIMLQLECEPKLYDKIELGKEDARKIDYVDLKRSVCEGEGLKKAKKLQRELSYKALGVLSKFPKSDARIALENIINTML